MFRDIVDSKHIREASKKGRSRGSDKRFFDNVNAWYTVASCKLLPNYFTNDIVGQFENYPAEN